MDKITNHDILNLNNNKVCQLAVFLGNELNHDVNIELISTRLKMLDGEIHLILSFMFKDKLKNVPIPLTKYGKIMKTIYFYHRVLSRLEIIGLFTCDSLADQLSNIFESIDFVYDVVLSWSEPKKFLEERLTNESVFSLELITHGVAGFLKDRLRLPVKLEAYKNIIQSEDDCCTHEYCISIVDLYSKAHLHITIGSDGLVLPKFLIYRGDTKDKASADSLNILVPKVQDLLVQLFDDDICLIVK